MLLKRCQKPMAEKARPRYGEKACLPRATHHLPPVRKLKRGDEVGNKK